MEQIKGMKIPGKQGPFGVRLLNTKETLDLGQQIADGKKPLDQLYVDICQMCLVYAKSGKQVYSPQQKPKMDKDLGGGRVVKIARQAMEHNAMLDDVDLEDQVKEAEKN